MAPKRPSLDTAIFLDVDGVLHSLHGDDLFKESCMDLFARIVRATDASIVLSSSWRVEAGKVAILNSVLQKRNLPRICDCTQDLNLPREVEICEWLDRHPRVVRWIAIDDMDLQGKPTQYAQRLQGHFVRTRSEAGLIQQDAELAVRLLLTQSLLPPPCRSPQSRHGSAIVFNPSESLLDLSTPTPVRNELQRCQRKPSTCHFVPSSSTATLPCEAARTPTLETRDLRRSPLVRGSLSYVPEIASRPVALSYVPEATPANRRSFIPEVQRRQQPMRTCPVLRGPMAGDISPVVQHRHIRRLPGCGQEAVPTAPAIAGSRSRLQSLGPVSA